MIKYYKSIYVINLESCIDSKEHINVKQHNNGDIIILKDSLFQPYFGEHVKFLYDTNINCNIYVCNYTPFKIEKFSL